MPTEYQGASAYELESDPLDLHNVARDGSSSKLEGMVATAMLDRCTVNVGPNEGRKGLLSGTWLAENPRNDRNLDPNRQVRGSIDAPPAPTANSFPPLEGKFRCFKIGGVSDPKVGYDRAKQFAGGARERHEMKLISAARTKAWQDFEIETARLFDTSANWQGTSVAELPGGKQILWAEDAAQPIADLVAMAELFFDNSGMKVSDIKIPLLVARKLMRNDEVRGYMVRYGVGGAAGLAIARNEASERVLTRTALEGVIRDVLANTDALKDVRVHVPTYRPFVQAVRAKAKASDRKYLWDQNSLWMGNLVAGATDFVGAEAAIENACAAAQFLNKDFEGRIKDDLVNEQIWGQVDRVFDLQVLHKDAGLHIADVLTAAA